MLMFQKVSCKLKEQNPHSSECGLCPALNPHGGDQVAVTYRTPKDIATTAINKLRTIKSITPSTGAFLMLAILSAQNVI